MKKGGVRNFCVVNQLFINVKTCFLSLFAQKVLIMFSMFNHGKRLLRVKLKSPFHKTGWLDEKSRRDVSRETVPSLTSYKWRKMVSVLAHSFLLPQRANSGYIVSISPWGTLEVSSVLRLKSVCYGMFCPLGLNEWRLPLQLNEICFSTLI